MRSSHGLSILSQSLIKNIWPDKFIASSSDFFYHVRCSHVFIAWSYEEERPAYLTTQPGMKKVPLTGAYWTPQTPRYIWGWWLESELISGWILQIFQYLTLFLVIFMGKFCHFATFVHLSMGLTNWFNTPLHVGYVCTLNKAPVSG